MLRRACGRQVASHMFGTNDRFRSTVCPLRGPSESSGEINMTRRTPAMVRFCGDRFVFGSGGGLSGEHHGGVSARPEDPTVPSVQSQLVLLDLLLLPGMTYDTASVPFEAPSLQDQAFVLQWILESTDPLRIVQAHIALLGCGIGSWLARRWRCSGQSIGPAPGSTVWPSHCESARGNQLGQQSKVLL